MSIECARKYIFIYFSGKVFHSLGIMRLNNTQPIEINLIFRSNEGPESEELNVHRVEQRCKTSGK